MKKDLECILEVSNSMTWRYEVNKLTEEEKKGVLEEIPLKLESLKAVANKYEKNGEMAACILVESIARDVKRIKEHIEREMKK